MGHRTTRLIKRNPPKIWSLDFPEDQFPPLPEFTEEYQFRVGLGKLRCKDATLQILGCARDIEKQVQRTLYTIEKIGSLFKDYRVHIHEGDSQDNTIKILRTKIQNSSKINVSSKNSGVVRLYDLSPTRFENMARVRNEYVNYFRENAYGDYVCVLDMDFRGSVSLDGICNSFGYFGRWDAITANGLDATEDYYYDCATYYPNDFENSLIEQKPGATYANIKKGFSRPLFKRGEPPIHVCSAFGGMAFYRQDAFLAGEYGSDLCDHASFHKTIWDKGYQSIMINPSMILVR